MLREVALEFLNDPDPEVMADVLLYLSRHGDASDEALIADRYSKLSERWRGLADELETPGFNPAIGGKPGSVSIWLML